MLKQNKNVHFWLTSGILAVLAFAISLSTMPIQADALWSSCGGFVDGGALVVTSGSPDCILTGVGTATSIQVQNNATLIIGDAGGDTAGALTASGNVQVWGNIIIADTTVDSTFVANGSFVKTYNNGNIENNGVLTTNELELDNTSTFTNTVDATVVVTEFVKVGSSSTQGPTFDNYGRVEIDVPGTTVGEGSLRVNYDGEFINRSTGYVEVDPNTGGAVWNGRMEIDPAVNDPLNTPLFDNYGELHYNNFIVGRAVSTPGLSPTTTVNNQSGATMHGYNTSITGYINAGGLINNIDGSTLFQNDGTIFFQGGVDEVAQFVNNDDNMVSYRVSLSTYGTFINNGTYNATAATGGIISISDANSRFDNLGIVIGGTSSTSNIQNGILTMSTGSQFSQNALIVGGTGSLSIDAGADLDLLNALNLYNTATASNAGTIEVSNNAFTYLRINDTSKFTNDGGTVLIENTAGPAFLLMEAGGEFINSGTASFNINGNGTANVEIHGTFNNFGTFGTTEYVIFDGTFDNNSTVTIGKNLTIQNTGVFDVDPASILNIGEDLYLTNVTSTFDNQNELNVGRVMHISNSQLDNNGTINLGPTSSLSTVDLGGAINNYGTIDLDQGGIAFYQNSSLLNDTGSSITGLSSNSRLAVNNDTASITNNGDIDIKDISIYGNTVGVSTASYTATSGSTTTLEDFQLGHNSNNFGGTATFDDGSTLDVTGQFSAQGYGILNFDTNDVTVESLAVSGGDASGGSIANFNKPTPGEYNIGVMIVGDSQATYSNIIEIDPGVVVNVADTIIPPGYTEFYSVLIGITPASGGNDQLIVNGTLNVSDDPVNPAIFEIGPNANLEIGADGFINFDDIDGEFRVVDGIVNDNSTDPVTEGIDSESNCEIGGVYDLNNRLDCVQLTIKDNGQLDVDPSAELNFTTDFILENLVIPFENSITLDIPEELFVNNSTFNNTATGVINFSPISDRSDIFAGGTLNNLGTINLDASRIDINDASLLYNEVDGVINGLPIDSHIKVAHDGGQFNNEGTIEVATIEIAGNTATGGQANFSSDSDITVQNLTVGNRSASTGGNLEIDLGATVIVNDNLVAEGYGEIIANSNITGNAALLAHGGDGPGGGTINLNDTTGLYEFGVIAIGLTEAGFTSTINIANGVEVELNTPIDPGDGTFTYGGVGFIGPNDGEQVINLEGTLRLNDDPTNVAHFYIGNDANDANGTLNIGINGLLDIDELDGQLIVKGAAPYGLVDNSDDPTTEGIDSEGECILDGNAEINNRMDCVNLIHVQDDGDVYVGLDGTVTVEGSDTIVDGFLELDGTWNAGNLTVNGPAGHISSGRGTITNFLINTEDLTVNTGGRIASDGVSTKIHPTTDGPGSYGGLGEGRLFNDVYGEIKLDSGDAPLYGESGRTAGVAEAGGNGGGAVRIYSTGNITIDGDVSANAHNAINPAGGGGSGGTVIIEHDPTDSGAFFTGTGQIMATGNGGNIDTMSAGGGGRISIISPFIDAANLARYDFNIPGIFASSGIVDDGVLDSHVASAGTIFYGGDTNNPNGDLVINFQGLTDTDPEVETTYISSLIDDDFDRVEVIGGGNFEFEDDAAPTVCYETDGTSTFPSIICTDYAWPDKPHSLFINTQATGAQGADLFQEPGYQVADGVSNEDLFVQDLNPVFSFVHSNPANPAAVITQIEIEVDDDPDFSSPVWDYLKVDLTQADGGDVVDGSRTEDIRYNEDGTGDALIDGVTYYIRSRLVNAPGLWSHADYNNQWRFTASAAPQPPAGGGTPVNHNGPGGGQRVVPYQPPAEEPVAEEPAAEEPISEEPDLSSVAPETQPDSQPVIESSTEVESQKVPRKPRSSAPEIDEELMEIIEEPIVAEDSVTDTSLSCSRADVTEKIINEFDLYNIYAANDERCQEDWDNCMLPFLIHSNYDATEKSYYPDVLLTEDLVGDSNPLPPVHPADLVGDSNPLPPVHPADLVGDSNPLPPVHPADLVGDSNPLPPVKVKAIEFGTRNRMLQGYFDEIDSPFRPFEIMSRIEVVKLLNFVIGQEWKYYDEYVAEIGGEENLENIDVKAGDISEWWHVRYYNYACENGFVSCDPSVNFEPNNDCTDAWLDELIVKYKKFYLDRGLDELQNADHDDDLLKDNDEVNLYFTDPLIQDSDEDDLKDGDEVIKYNTNPSLQDTDADGLTDGEEINIHQTNPKRLDTDGDGASDLVEINNGTDPNDPTDVPDIEAWKSIYDLTLENGSMDSDLDGLSDLLEYKYGTDPLNPDTDEDGLSDGEEVLLYNTDPLVKTNIEELGVNITNLKNGMILTDLRPLIQGITPQPEMDVLIILRNKYGHEIQLGKTVSDEKGVFILTPDFDLRDGEFFLLAKALDPKNSQVLNSPLVSVSLDSSLMVEKPTPERLADQLISEEILLKKLVTNVGSKMPTLSGKTGYKNQVIATWQSVVGVSSIIADISAGEFHITAPNELPYGEHIVSAYAIRESDQAMSKIVGIPFNVKEAEKQIISFEPVKQDNSFILYIVLGVIVVIAVGLVYYIRSRKKAKTPVSDKPNKDEKNIAKN